MPGALPIKILALDTATPRSSVALLEGAELMAEWRLYSPETHSARLLRSIEHMAEQAGWALADLNLIAAGIGPGSFTGIRIGVATALGLAQTLALPFAPVSGLDAVAHSVRLIHGRLGVVMDAQRAQVYYAEYISEGGKIRRLVRPALYTPRDLKARIVPRGLHLVGDGVQRYACELKSLSAGWPRLLETDLFLAPSIARLALKRRRAWRIGPYLQAQPLYVRPPDALRARAAK